MPAAPGRSKLSVWCARAALVVAVWGLLAGLGVFYADSARGTREHRAGAGALCVSSVVLAAAVLRGRRRGGGRRLASSRACTPRPAGAAAAAPRITATADAAGPHPANAALASAVELLCTDGICGGDLGASARRLVQLRRLGARLHGAGPPGPAQRLAGHISVLEQKLYGRMEQRMEECLGRGRWIEALRVTEAVRAAFPGSPLARRAASAETRVSRHVQEAIHARRLRRGGGGAGGRVRRGAGSGPL